MHEYFNDVLSKFQFRFRKDHGVQHILSFIIGNSKQFRDNKGAFAAVLTDLLQAFDFIWHEPLIRKLNSYGFDEIW